MPIPSWLSNITGAMQFANNPANNFQPTVGDAFQGIGHSMMEHFRAGQGQPASAPAAPMIGQQPTVGQLAGQATAPPAAARPPMAPPINFIPPDLQSLIMRNSPLPQVNQPAPLAGQGLPLDQIARLFR